MKKLLTALFFTAGTLATMGVAVADDDYLEHKAQQSAKISYEKAAELARQAVGGGDVLDVDFEWSVTGRHYYDVEVAKDYQEYDVKIDANTGKVVSKRIDY